MLKLMIPIVGGVMLAAGAAYGQGLPIPGLGTTNGTLTVDDSDGDETTFNVTLTPGGASDGAADPPLDPGTGTLNILAGPPPVIEPPSRP